MLLHFHNEALFVYDTHYRHQTPTGGNVQTTRQKYCNSQGTINGT